MGAKDAVINRIFSETAARFAQKTALQIKRGDFWQRFSYRDVEEASQKVAAYLIREGFKSGDAAALISENCPEWAVVYLGITRAGLVCVPLDPQLSLSEISNLVTDSKAKIIFCSRELLTGKLRDACAGISLRCFMLEEMESVLRSLTTEGISWPRVSAEDTASLIYTSGTTAKPKGVLLSHGNFSSNFSSIRKADLCSESDTFLLILPLYHSYAFMASLLVPLLTGATVTFCPSLKPQDINAAIKETGVTILIGVPRFFQMLYKRISERVGQAPLILRPLITPFMRLSLRRLMGGLRLSVCGGARLEPKIGRGLLDFGLKVVEGYGLTEASPVVSLNHPEKIKFGSAGRPLPDVFVKIDHPDSAGAGRILVKGPNVMSGYHNNAQLTKETIKDGWLYTSDIGHIDKEGYLFLTGRQEEILVLSSGKNIYPEELEEYYGQSPYIKELCILLRQDTVFRQSRDLLYAVVVPDFEYFSRQREANLRERIRWDLDTLGRKLPPYKRIMGIILTKKELARTALHKIKRFTVMQEYLRKGEPEIKEEAKASTEEERRILEGETAAKIFDYIAKETARPVRLDSHLEIDLGIDSLARVEMGAGLEALLGIGIPDEMLYSVSTVKDVVIGLQELLKERGGLVLGKNAARDWQEILSEPPPGPVLGKIKLRFGLSERMLTLLFKSAIFSFLFRLCWSLRAQGRENLPEQGPYLICPNHASYLDGLFVFTSLPFKIAMSTYFLGYQRIFEHPLFVWANKICRLISVDASSRLAEAMRAVSFCLSKGKIVCIFPEGMRSIDSEVNDFKKGAGILMKELDIPAIPVYISGSHYSWPRGSRVPRPYPVRVIFGKPLRWRQLGNTYDEIAEGLRQEAMKLAVKKVKKSRK